MAGIQTGTEGEAGTQAGTQAGSRVGSRVGIKERLFDATPASSPQVR